MISDKLYIDIFSKPFIQIGMNVPQANPFSKQDVGISSPA
jgi:hypothetical protein